MRGFIYKLWAKGYIASVLTGGGVGLIAGILFAIKWDSSIIKVGTIGGLVGMTFIATGLFLETWFSKCDQCGSRNLVAWDYDRDSCQDCGAAVPSYETQNTAFRARHPEIFGKKKPLQ